MEIKQKLNMSKAITFLLFSITALMLSILLCLFLTMALKEQNPFREI